MAQELTLADFVYDHEYYVSTHEEVCKVKEEVCQEWQKGRDYYIENGIKNCEAPNEVFAKDHNLLYQEDESGKKECKLDNWGEGLDQFGRDYLLNKGYYQPGDKQEKSYKWDLFKGNLLEIMRSRPEAIESGIEKNKGSFVEKLLLETIEKESGYKLKEETIRYLEGRLEKGFKANKCAEDPGKKVSRCSLELKILSNQVISHPQETYEHSDFILNLTSDKEMDKSAYGTILESFTKEELTRIGYKAVEEHFKKQYQRYNCSDQKCDLDELILVHYIDHYSKEEADIEELIQTIKKLNFDEKAREVVFGKIAKDAGIISKEKLDKYTKLLEVDKESKLAKGYVEAYRKQGYVLNIKYLDHIMRLIEDKEDKEAVISIASRAIEDEIREPKGEVSFERIELYLEKILDKMTGKIEELPKSLMRAIFEYYEKDQSYFTKEIVKILAENKLLERDLVKKIKDILLKIGDKKAKLFIARRISDHHIELEQEKLRHLSELLKEEETRVAAIDYFTRILWKVEEDMQIEIGRKLLEAVRTKAEFAKVSKAGGLREEVKELIELVKDVLENNIKKIEEAAKKNVNQEILKSYLERLLRTQEEEKLRLFLNLREKLEGNEQINFEGRGVDKLLELVNKIDKNDEELGEYKKVQIGGEIYIVSKEQYEELSKDLSSLGEKKEYIYKLKYRSFEDVLSLIKFIDREGIEVSELGESLNEEINDQELYEELCKNLIGKYQKDKELSRADKKLVERSYRVLVDKQNWEARELYKIIKAKEFLLLQKIVNYELSPTDTGRECKAAEELFKKDDLSDAREDLNKLIADQRFFIPKSTEGILHELKQLNRGLNDEAVEQVESGYYEEQLRKWNKYQVDCSEKSKECPFDKEPRLWSEEEFIAWVSGLAGITDENIAVSLYVISEAAKLKLDFLKNSYPKEVQIVAVLSLYKASEGILAQIATGEGKSLIIAMFAIIKMLENQGHKRQIDIVTSSRELAPRDVESMKEYYGVFGITVSHNIRENPQYSSDCYKADIVYGDPMNFIADTLRDISKNTKQGRGFDLIIIDEVDNLMIDQSNMKIQLTSTIVGMDMLGQLLVNIWGEGVKFISSSEQKKEGCYYKQESLDEEKIRELEELGVNVSEAKARVEPIYLGSNCEEILKKGLKDYTETHLLDYNQTNKTLRSIVIPSHLEEFAMEQVSRWTKSFMDAVVWNEEDKEYVVMRSPGADNSNRYKVAAPIDSEKTGTIQFKLQLSDGLQQFLQLKHKLTLTAENIITTFMSYYGFLGKYKGNIYGVTGTLGDKPNQGYLKEVHGVELMKVPTFIEKDLIKYEAVIVGNEYEWIDEIVDTVKREAQGKRAVLMIIEKLRDVQDVYFALKERYSRGQVYMYSKGGQEELGIVGRTLDAGDVIVASNLAGRGTDLKLDSEIIKNGGLHVIVGTFPNYVRVQDQAYGRAARQSEPGSAQMILNSGVTNNYVMYAKCGEDIECLSRARTEHEYLKLTEDRLCKLPMLKLKDELFDLFTEELKGINSPTGYPITIGEGDSANDGIYLYMKSGEVAVKVVRHKKDGADIKEFGEDYLSTVDKKATNHIKTVLANKGNKESSLNRQDFELMNYIAANEGYTNINVIIKRVNYKLDKLIEAASSACIDEKSGLKDDAYFNCLHEEDEKYNDIDGTVRDLVEKIKLRKKFELWLEDREKYNTESEVAQATEYFGMWLKRNSGYFDMNCNVKFKDEEGDLEKRITYNVTTIELKLNKTREELEESFGNFTTDIGIKKQKGELFENANLLVLKAWKLMRLETGEKDTREHLSGKSDSGFFGRVSSMFGKVISIGRSMLFGEEEYNPTSPISTAVECLGNASKKEPYYSWTTYNALSFAKLIKNGTDLVRLTEKNAKKAYNVKKEFIEDAGKAIERISNSVIPVYESELAYLGQMNLLDYDDDIAVQLIGAIKVYEGIIQALQNNIDFIVKLSGKEMIKMGRHVPLEEATEKAEVYTIGNVTEIVQKQLNSSALKAATKKIEFESYNYTIDQITLAGGYLFKLDSYELKQKKNWWGTIFAAVIGIATIWSGMWVLGHWGLGAAGAAGAAAGAAATGSVFGTAFGGALVFQGIGDIIGSLIAVGTGNPIDFGQFINSKGMSLGVALATAGTLHFLSGIEAINNALSITEKLSNLQSAYNAGTTAFLVGATTAQVAVTGTSALIYNGLKRTVDEEDIEVEVERAINKLLEEDNEKLNKIFATDKFYENVGDQERRNYLTKLLYEEVEGIVSGYLGRFKGDKETFAMDYSLDVVGQAVGGMGATGIFGFANIIKTAGKALQGIKKNAEAISKITDRVRNAIEKISAMAINAPEMMMLELQAGSNAATQDQANSIKEALLRYGYISESSNKYQEEGEITKECDSMRSLMLSDTLAIYKDKLINACKSTKSIFSQGFEDKYNELKSKLVSSTKETKTQIQKHELVKPIANGLGAEAGDSLMKTSFAKRMMSKVYKTFGVYEPTEEEKHIEADRIAAAHGSLDAALRNQARVEHNNLKNAINTGRETHDASKLAHESGIGIIKPEPITIEEGKVLSDYALQYGTTVEELAELNNIENPDIIKTGEKLQIPETARYPDGDNPNYVNRINNQKSSILQPTDIKLSDDQNSVFTNTCPVNQGTCVNTATQNEDRKNENDNIKKLIENIVGISLTEDGYQKLITGNSNELEKADQNKIKILAAFWRYAKSGSISTDEKDLKQFVSGDCNGCEKNLKNIIDTHRNGANLQIFDSSTVDQGAELVNTGAEKLNPVLKFLADQWDKLNNKLTDGHNKEVTQGKGNRLIQNLFPDTAVDYGASTITNTIENVKSFWNNRVTDDQKEALEALTFFSTMSFMTKSGYSIKTVEDIKKIQMVAASDITISEATVKYFYTRDSQLINYKKIVEIEKSIFEYEPSFTKGTNAIEMQLKHGDEFVRVTGPKSHKYGNWVMLREDAVGLTPQQFKEKFALEFKPTHYVDVKITNPTKDHKVLIGKVAPNFQEKGGGNQLFMGFKIDPKDKNFNKIEPWFGSKQVIPNEGIK